MNRTAKPGAQSHYDRLAWASPRPQAAHPAAALVPGLCAPPALPSLDHKIQHYIGAILPQSVKVKDEFAIRDLRKEQAVQGLGLPAAGSQAAQDRTGYGITEKQAVAVLDSLSRPRKRRLRTYRAQCGTSWWILPYARHCVNITRFDPVAIANTRDGLTAQNKFALGLDKSGAIFSVMRALPSAIDKGQEKTQEEITRAAGDYDVLLMFRLPSLYDYFLSP
ncbi:hypothetical protein B0H17DRAFT_1285914 [Mycena rosella]|uniref:Uncharacterized protein n=1 Tax=Mycena rosella TaxID=1033263 RepID=A0AAD7DHD2_MYCRO|nr:hypothetical protein B0H17DRAFT_1285914 [Mycena rosella]